MALLSLHVSTMCYLFFLFIVQTIWDLIGLKELCIVLNIHGNEIIFWMQIVKESISSS